jgi:hypothetical protein
MAETERSNKSPPVKAITMEYVTRDAVVTPAATGEIGKAKLLPASLAAALDDSMDKPTYVLEQAYAAPLGSSRRMNTRSRKMWDKTMGPGIKKPFIPDYLKVPTATGEILKTIKNLEHQEMKIKDDLRRIQARLLMERERVYCRTAEYAREELKAPTNGGGGSR